MSGPRKELKNRLYNARVIHIIGFTGTEGESAVKLLSVHTGAKTALHDIAGRDSLWESYRRAREFFPAKTVEKNFSELINLCNDLRLGGDYLSGIDPRDIILLSQDWDRYPENRKAVDSHHEKGGLAFLIFDLYYLFCRGKIIGITGTKGKTTSAHLTLNLLKSWGKEAYISGNDRYSKQMLPEIPEMKEDSWLILETSNRHLKHSLFKPDIAMITNIDIDHLEEHNNDPQKYINTKLRIIEKDSCAIIPLEVYSMNRENIDTGELILFSLKKPPSDIRASHPVIYLKDSIITTEYMGAERKLFSADNINKSIYRSNLLMVSGLACYLDIPAFILPEAFNQDLGIKSRFEFIGTKSGINFIDDLSATTPYAAIQAIESVKGNIILICGGETKGNDYSFFIQSLENTRIKRAYILDNENLKSSLINGLSGKMKNSSKIILATSFRDTITDAYDFAKPGDTIILSPACAGFYSNFVKSRANAFRVNFRMLKTKLQDQSNE